MPDLTTEVEEKLRLTKKKDRSLADQNVSVVFIVEKCFYVKQSYCMSTSLKFATENVRFLIRI